MITILWTMYLAAMLMLTVVSITTTIYSIREKGIISSTQNAIIILACILWAIWYMYFLH